jgi:PhoD-like phosphatase, N-terminal domain
MRLSKAHAQTCCTHLSLHLHRWRRFVCAAASLLMIHNPTARADPEDARLQLAAAGAGCASQRTRRRPPDVWLHQQPRVCFALRGRQSGFAIGDPNASQAPAGAGQEDASSRLLAAKDADAFASGVGSGDPLHDRVILWARVSPPTAGFNRVFAVRWVVYADAELTEVVTKGQVSTNKVSVPHESFGQN